MKVLRTFIAGLVLSTPVTVFAQVVDEPEEQQEPEPLDQPPEPMPPEPQPPEEQPQPPVAEEPEQPQPTGEGAAEKSPEQKNKVKQHVIPAKAGIDAAESAATALHQMAQGEKLEAKDTKKSLKLAKQGVGMALTRAENLTKVEGLSDDAKSNAREAQDKLRDAQQTLQQLEKRMDQKKIAEKDLQQIREQTKELQSNLSEAGDSIEQVAKAYDVQFQGEMGG